MQEFFHSWWLRMRCFKSTSISISSAQLLCGSEPEAVSLPERSGTHFPLFLEQNKAADFVGLWSRALAQMVTDSRTRWKHGRRYFLACPCRSFLCGTGILEQTPEQALSSELFYMVPLSDVILEPFKGSTFTSLAGWNPYCLPVSSFNSHHDVNDFQVNSRCIWWH